MKQLIKTIVTIIIAALVVVVIRTYFYTVSTVTADLGQTLRSGDRVLVNKVGKHTFRRGDLMVFHPGLPQAKTAPTWIPGCRLLPSTRPHS